MRWHILRLTRRAWTSHLHTSLLQTHPAEPYTYHGRQTQAQCYWRGGRRGTQGWSIIHSRCRPMILTAQHRSARHPLQLPTRKLRMTPRLHVERHSILQSSWSKSFRSCLLVPSCLMPRWSLGLGTMSSKPHQSSGRFSGKDHRTCWPRSQMASRDPATDPFTIIQTS